MEHNPILEEVWRIKDELASEAGGEVHRLCENTRRWAAQHPHSGPAIRNADELRYMAREYEARSSLSSASTMNDSQLPEK